MQCNQMQWFFEALGGNPKVGHMKIKIARLNVLMKKEPNATDCVKLPSLVREMRSRLDKTQGYIFFK